MAEYRPGYRDGYRHGGGRPARHRAQPGTDYGEGYRDGYRYAGDDGWHATAPYHHEDAGPARYREPDLPRRREPDRLPGRGAMGGAAGNERLTAITGAALLILLAAEGITILALHQLLTLHFFIGMLLVGPVLLKSCSTVYRFARYYTGAPDYRRKGPPSPLLRLLGPFVLLLSLAVIGTGIMLGVTGPGPSAQTWLFLHKATFVLWFCAMTIHVLAYVWRLPRLIGGDLAARAGARARDVLAGRGTRWLLLTASIVGGLVLAMATVHMAGAWTGFSGGR